MIDNAEGIPMKFMNSLSLNSSRVCSILKAVGLMAVLLPVSKLSAEIHFEETTVQAGVEYIGRSFGASWGDFNGDGYPDLYTNNHQSKPSLFLNQKDGTFLDVYDTWIGFNDIFSASDQHGSSWADYDNDGDQDLIVLVGGNGGGGTSRRNRNHLYTNTGETLLESSEALGIDLPTARGRSPLWFDYDNDGLLDVAVSNLVSGGTPITTLFRQLSTGFIDVGAESGFQIPENTNVLQLVDIDNDDHPEIVAQASSYGLKVYDYAYSPITEITSSVISKPTLARGNGVIWGDYDLNGLPDLYVPLGSKKNELTFTSANAFNFALFVADDAKTLSFTFQTTGPVTFDLSAPWHNLGLFVIGANNTSASGWQLILDPEDPSVQGLPAYVPEGDRGIYIGYDAPSNLWTVVLNTDFVNYGALDNLLGIVNSENEITLIDASGFETTPRIWNNAILMNEGGDIVSRSGQWQVNEALPSIAAVSGDFDNDMDIDIYVVNSMGTSNFPNTLYENMGSTFAKVPMAGGAEGTNLGIGQGAALADYDQDGFLDIYVMNGGYEPPFSDLGYHQLFRNRGNENHWIQIDLEGVSANRDAIGSKVYVIAGGITQSREQSGQMHYYSQNHKRLHFGLGQNTVIDEIIIVWPDGNKQHYYDILADQTLHLTQKMASVSVYGEPSYVVGQETGVFIWKEFFDGPYHVAAVSDEQSRDFDIQVLSDQALVSANAAGVEPGISFSLLENGFAFHSLIINSQEIINFQLPSSSESLIAVTQNDRPNPRTVYFGQERENAEPEGWIINTGEISPIADYNVGKGVVTRAGSNNEKDFVVRATANRFRHHWLYKLLLPSQYTFNPSHLENGDDYQLSTYSASIDSLVTGPWQDGFSLGFVSPQWVGLSMWQDSIPQHHRGIINNAAGKSITSNAYRLPRAEPYGAPQYSNGDKVASYVWKDEISNIWLFRFTAGGGSSQKFIGTINSSVPFSSVDQLSIETSDDITISSDGRSISFSIIVAKVWYDGIDIELPEGATLTYDLTQSPGQVAPVFIGQQQWPVLSVPLEFMGW
jgi:hypothetical protein